MGQQACVLFESYRYPTSNSTASSATARCSALTIVLAFFTLSHVVMFLDSGMELS